MIDHEHIALVQDLETKNVLCTRGDWIKLGRIYHALTDLHDSKGQELFISMEGILLREPKVTAKLIICKLKNFPIYLLGKSIWELRPFG